MVRPRASAPAPANSRQPSGLLLLGIYVLPIVFAWWTLRRGYRTSLRVTAFVMLVFTGVGGYIKLRDPSYAIAGSVASEPDLAKPTRLVEEDVQAY